MSRLFQCKPELVFLSHLHELAEFFQTKVSLLIELSAFLSPLTSHHLQENKRKGEKSKERRQKASNKDNDMQVLLVPCPFCSLKLCLVVWQECEFGESWIGGTLEGGVGWLGGFSLRKQHGILSLAQRGRRAFSFITQILCLLSTYSCKIPRA